MRAWLLVPVAGVLAGGCAGSGSGQASAAREVTGCYQFRWTDQAAELGLPWGFELLAEPLEGWPNIPGGRRARTRVTETSVRDHPFAFWMPLAGDTIRVGHPGGGGFTLTLTPRGRDLAGGARPTGDAVPPGGGEQGRARPVTALRVVCPPPGQPRQVSR